MWAEFEGTLLRISLRRHFKNFIIKLRYLSLFLAKIELMLKKSYVILLVFFTSCSLLLGQFQEEVFQVSHIYPKGVFEVHLFNSYFSRKSKIDNDSYNKRESFYSAIGQFTYGLSSRLNLGIDLRLRSVSVSEGFEEPFFNALKFRNGGNFSEGNHSGYRRVALSELGLRAKYQPVSYLKDFSIQHTLYLPLRTDLEGNDDTGFADWQAGIFLTQFFMDRLIGSKFLLFTELDLSFEDVGVPLFEPENAYYQYGFPLTFIGSYIINSRNFIYGLVNAAPTWGVNYTKESDEHKSSFVPYAQLGLGYKVFVKNFQFELLWTRFFDTTENAHASTVNLGIRVFGKLKDKK